MYPAPPHIPKAQLATLLENLLFFLYGGPQLNPLQQVQARQGIQQFADSSPNQLTVVDHAQHQNINLAAIGALAPQIAPMMDAFFLQHNVQWNAANNAYDFLSTQRAAWDFPVEDINSTRQYCVLPTNNVAQMLSNLLNLLKRARR